METNNKENENYDTLALRTPSPTKRHSKRNHDEAGEPLEKPNYKFSPRKKRRSSIPGKSILKSLMDPNYDPFDVNENKNENKTEAEATDNTVTLNLAFEEVKKPTQKKKKSRKSLGRRVSFAATAHVRLFDKEAEDWKTSGTPKPTRTTTFFSGADSPPDFSAQLDANDGDTVSGDLTGNPFQIPDLSSVQQRNSNAFQLRLSLDGNSKPADLTITSDNESEKSQRSFDINLKGYHTDTESDVDSLLGSGRKLAASIPTEDPSISKEDDHTTTTAADKTPVPAAPFRFSLATRRESMGAAWDESESMELVSSDDDNNKDGERGADVSFAVSDGNGSDLSMDVTECLGGIAGTIDKKKNEEGSSTQAVGWGAAIAGAAAATARAGIGLFGLRSPVAGGSPVFGFKRGARNPFVSGAGLVFGMDDDERNAEDEEGGVTMDVTKCVGGIQGIDDVEDDDEEEEEEEEEEMELTRAVGGIRGVLGVSSEEGNEQEEDDEEEDMEAMTMELTKAVGGIKELKKSRTDLTFDQVEDEASRTRRATLATVEAEEFDSKKTLEALAGRRRSISSVISYQPSPSVSRVLQSPVRTPKRTPKRGGVLEFLDTPKGKKAEKKEEVTAEVLISSKTPTKPVPADTTATAAAAAADTTTATTATAAATAALALVPAPVRPVESTGVTESLADGRHTNDIFEERLTVLDDSFVAEEISYPASPPPNVSMRDFLDWAGITFMDGLTTMKRRETMTVNRETDAAPTLSDCVTAAACSIPELELYQFCCQELSRYIEEGKAAVQKIEEDVGQSNPHFFHEYLDGSADLREFMEQRFKLIKTHSRLSAKENWYDWRDKLVTDMNELLKKNLAHLQRDKKYVNQFSEQLEEVIPEVESYHAELTKRYQEAKAREEEIAKCDKDELQSLEEAIEEQKEQLTIFGKELQTLEAQEAEIKAKVAKTEEEKMEILAAIEKAHAICEESKCVTKEDLDKARNEYSHVIAMHGWVPKRVSARQVEFVFDDAVRVRIDPTKVKEWEGKGAAEVELVDELKIGKFGIFLSGIKAMTPKWHIREILQDIGCYWNKVTLLRDELWRLSLKHSLDLSVSPETNKLTAHVTFFSYTTRTKVYIELVFGEEDVRVYPNLKDLRSKVEVVYGEVKEEAVSKVVKKALEKGGYEALKRMCVELVEVVGK